MGKIIAVEGYKAFSGCMLIEFIKRPSQYIRGDWLYRPDTGCWYCNGLSYPAVICTIWEVE